MKPINEKKQIQIREEWDNISKIRYNQIIDGKDISYRYVILPCVLDLAKKSNFSKVIDIGCGTGVLTSMLAKRSNKVLAIDISPKSIEITKSHCKKQKNILFNTISIEDYAFKCKSQTFTLAIANMTIMTCLNLFSFLKAIEKLLIKGGTFIMTGIHPCFWPQYWGYDKAKWFDYKKEIIIEAPFRISKDITEYKTTHIHRPLDMYINMLIRCGFIINKIIEPIPNNNIQKLYPNIWKFPRFIGIRCIKK
ncbi:MAG: methyltransferase domain-containing protein [Sedimentisphaerales bacterium]|nr:methyltransferase domain-containing protein [Sedimentisphaerales bacterium]